jgi:hypothetical protein
MTQDFKHSLFLAAQSKTRITSGIGIKTRGIFYLRAAVAFNLRKTFDRK